MALGSAAFAAVVPAAGRAERFGGAKLIADLRGQPLLDHTLRCLLDAGAVLVVVVTGESPNLEPVSLLRDERVRTLVNPAPDRGMFSSIQVGLGALDDGEQVLILPGDMPFVHQETVRRVAAAAAAICRPVTPVYQNRRGHPISVPADLLPALRSADSMQSLKHALLAAGADRVDVTVEDPGILQDVDVRADLER